VHDPNALPAPSDPRHAVAWSREETVRAAEMWRQGSSAGVIAAALGVSRSAVVAKLRRLGVKRAVLAPTVSPRPPPAKPRKPKPSPPPKLVCKPRWIEITELRPGLCRYPRETESGVRFCGGATGSLSSSWCPAHKLICCATDPRRRA
jgi:hypothetical protein